MNTMSSSHPGDGKVAVYRWFENGEGWAFHPWFSARGLELSRALDPVLKRGGGLFCVPALNGYLVGEQSEDESFPDPKARLRRPTILRAVFFARRPIESDCQRAVAALRELSLPTQRREDPHLALDAERFADFAFEANEPATSIPTAGGAGRGTSNRVRLVAAVLLGLATLILVSVLVVRHLQTGRPEPAPEPGPEAIGAPRPAPPIEDPSVRLDMLTAGRFRQALGPHAKVDHPYTAYLKAQSERLPESTSVYQDRKQLRKLLPDLLRDVPADAEKMSDDALLDTIVAQLNYERWREGPGKRDYRDRDKPLPEDLRRFVERFRQPSAALQKSAVAMAELLQGWGEREPSPRYAGQYPLTAIDRFFAFLTRPRFAPRPLTLDHPKVHFLWRLPADPIAEGMTFDNDVELAQALRQLLHHLDPRSNPRDESESSTELLRKIAAALHYDAWRRGDGARTYVDEEKDPGREVDDFVARFARNP
jgi:hypothetical protein